MIKVKVIKRYIQTLPIQDLIMRTDHLAESIQFELTNWIEDIDYGAEGWQWFIYYKTTVDPPVVTPITYSVSGDGTYTYLLWEIDHNISKRSGNLDFQIRGKRDTENGLIEWNSSVATINIGHALDPDDHDTDENILEWYLDRMEQLAQSGQVDITAERERAMAAEAEITANLNAEIERSTTEDDNLHQRIDNLTSSTVQSVTELRRDLTNEIERSTKEDFRLNNELQKEINRAKEAESVLQDNINAESNRAQEAENQLREDLTAETNRATEAERVLQENIDAEQNRAETEEQKIRDEMSQMNSDLTDALNAETERAKTAEKALDDKINAETERATEAETQLGEDLLAEQNRAEQAEQDLDTRLTQEIERATTTETQIKNDLTEALNNEIDRAIERENQIEQDAQLNLENESNRAQDAEKALDEKIVAETDRATAEERRIESSLTNALNTEISRATAAESSLNDKLNTETNRAIGREEELDDKIEAEITRATLAEDNLSKSLASAKSELQGNIDAEKARAEKAEATLQTNINNVDTKLDAEIERATQAEADMGSRVDILEEGMNSRINQLVSNLNSEITRSTAKDQEHDDEINELTTNLNSTDSKLDQEISRSTIQDETTTEEISSFTIRKVENPSATVSARYYLELTRNNTQLIRGAYIDIPVTDAVTGGRFDDTTGNLVLILANGDQIEVPIGDLVQYYEAAEGIQILRLDETHNAFAIKLNQVSGTQGILSTSDDGLAIDLSRYYTKTEADGLLATKQPMLHQQAADPDNKYTPSIYIDSANTIYVNPQILAELTVAYQIANQNQANILQLSSTTINGIVISDENESGIVRKNVILYDGDLTDGEVLIASGTRGLYKTSGFSIKKSVPADAKFTDTLYYPTSEDNPNGLFTREEQEKLLGIQAGAEVNVQADWNATDGDAFIRNKPINATQTVDGFMSSEDKTKLDGVETGAEVNQNAFSKVSVGGVTLSSTAKEDTLTVNSSNGISVSGSGKTLSIKGTNVSSSANGMMLSTDKQKLDTVEEGAEVNQNAISKITAGGTTLSSNTKEDTFTINGSNGIKVSGSGKTITVAGQDVTQSTNGVMIAADKTKLDGIASGAEVNQNAFSKVQVGSSTANATTKTDTLILTGGGGTSISVSGKTVTITSKQTDQADWNQTDTNSPSYIKNKPGLATPTSDGFMSAEDKARLDELDAEYLPLTGGTMTGDINSQNIVPTANNTYNIGSDSNRIKNLYSTNAVYLGTPADGKGMFYNATTGGFDFIC